MGVAVKEAGEKVNVILKKYRHDASMLVSILQDVQAEYRYLPRETLEEVSRSLDVPVSRVYSVATFFKAFSLEPRGKHLVHVCLGTACHVRGAVQVLEKMEQTLRTKAGGTTPDLAFTLETVNCIGACALGPMVIIDENYHGNMNPEKVEKVVKSYA